MVKANDVGHGQTWPGHHRGRRQRQVTILGSPSQVLFSSRIALTDDVAN